MWLLQYSSNTVAMLPYQFASHHLTISLLNINTIIEQY